MDLREFDHAKIADTASQRNEKSPADVRITLAFTVRDRELLWDAAAVAGLAAPGMSLSDVVDVIGPREDPAIAECIAMLAQPATIAGCELAGFGAELNLRSRVQAKAA